MAFLDISADRIKQWSHEHQAAGVLPELVRRLLLATSALSKLSMPAHSGVRLSGWDGRVHCTDQSPFCPVGASFWELSVEATSGKLDGDYRKRTLETPDLIRRTTTYVAVTARRIKKKHDWVQAKLEDSDWEQVALLDADDLSAWLATAPSVAAWFAEHLGIPTADLEIPDEWLDDWAARTQPPLPTALLLVGRDRRIAAERFLAWARSAGGACAPFRVHADTRDEALAFCVAALVSDETSEGQQTRARSVIARSEQGLRWLRRAQPAVILIGFDAKTPPAGPIVVPMEGPFARTTSVDVRLGPIPYRRIAEVLATSLPHDEAEKLAERSGGRLSTLQRLLGHESSPGWAIAADANLYALLLIESFEPRNADDRDVLACLGVDPQQVELLCERLSQSADPPVHREQTRMDRGAWQWRSPDEAWALLAARIPEALLQAFTEVVLLVLGERDPSLDLEPNQRHVAPLSGKAIRASGRLRAGIARSLVRLALRDEDLVTLHGSLRGSRLAGYAVRELLPGPWSAWASLAELLPTLAEAAPDAFLTAIEASLRLGDVGAARLLAEEPTVGLGRSPHVPLLWALEALGWEPTLMPRVASALAVLATHDRALPKEGRTSNRPGASLHNLLRLARPQTAASVQERVAEVGRRLAETPEVAFDLLTSEFGSMGTIVLLMPAERATIRPMPHVTDEHQEERYRTEGPIAARSYLELLIQAAGSAPARWAQLVTEARDPDVQDRILSELEARRTQLLDDDGLLWASIRHVLHWCVDESDQPGVDDVRSRRARWLVLYGHFRPDDLVRRAAWLFTTRLELPEPFSPRADLHEEFRRADALRSNVVEELGCQADRWAILETLAASVSEPHLLGRALGASSFVADLDAWLVDAAPPTAMESVVPGYVVSRWLQAGNDWLELKACAMLRNDRKQLALASFLAFGSHPPIWAVLDRVDADLRRAYWHSLKHVLGVETSEHWERAISALLEARNIAVAVESAAWAKQKVTLDTVIRVLTELLKASPDELARFGSIGSPSHSLETLLERFDTDSSIGAANLELLTAVELMDAHLARRPGRPLVRLSGYFAANPSYFVTAVTDQYRGRGEPAPQTSSAEAEARAAKAQNARKRLSAWKGYPGEGLPVADRDQILFDWSVAVLRTLGAEARASTGASEVARVLIRVPRGDDGHWPGTATRRLLELGEFEDLPHGLEIAHLNARGMTGRSLGEGGRQEREIAHRLRGSATFLRLAHPRTSTFLDRLALWYEERARGEDDEARITMREEGAEPEDYEPKHREPQKDTGPDADDDGNDDDEGSYS